VRRWWAIERKRGGEEREREGRRGRRGEGAGGVKSKQRRK
jgi:hypothetical protein